MGGSIGDYGQSIVTDDSGNVYVAGYYCGTVDFDPDTSIFNITPKGSWDIFVQKLDGNGNFIWAKSIGGIDYDAGFSITNDATGNVYVTGIFENTVDFDPNAGTYYLTSNGLHDVFVLKLDRNGNFSWAKSMGGTAVDRGLSITTCDSGNVYLTGIYKTTVDFDPDTSTFNLTSNGDFDVFIQKLGESGELKWAKSIGGTATDFGYFITTGSLGRVYVTGAYQSKVDFSPGADTFNLTSNGNYDIFIQKLGPCVPNSGVDVTTACDSLTWIDGITYFVSNSTATFIFTNTAGCDSTVTLDLTINASNTVQDVITACDSITWIDGVTYFASNDSATFMLTNANGCDSLVTLNLTIKSNTGVDVITACDSLIWIDGITYTENINSPTFTLTNAANCDSVVILNLTINNSNTGLDVITACDSITWIDGIT